jgi:tetrahydromethanopterin S-methyltransferase subunit E
MNRTFQARLTWHSLLLLLLLGGCLIYLLWMKDILPAALAAILLILVLEQTLHSTYTITADGYLIVRRGRFRRQVSLKLQDVKKVTRARIMKIGGIAMVGYVHIEYANRYVSIFPMHEDVFLEVMRKHGIEINEF